MRTLRIFGDHIKLYPSPMHDPSLRQGLCRGAATAAWEALANDGRGPRRPRGPRGPRDPRGPSQSF